jgi:hypothetical protein
VGSPVISVPVDRELQSKAIGRYAVSKSFTHFDEVLLLFPALLTLAQAASSAQPQRPSKTPSTVVEIQGRVIQLPHLPESVQQAHSEYGRIKLQLEQDLVDLERNLQELYMDPDQSEPLPPQLKSAAMLEAEKNLRIQMTTVGSAGSSGGNPRTGFGPENPSSIAMGVHAQLVEENLMTTRSIMLINDRKAPSLSRCWTPFADYLNECAQKLNNFEGPRPAGQDLDVRILRAQAKVHFLERYRSALWFCSVVWARMAAGKPPSPLRELGR